jgi:hypothetical protein
MDSPEGIRVKQVCSTFLLGSVDIIMQYIIIFTLSDIIHSLRTCSRSFKKQIGQIYNLYITKSQPKVYKNKIYEHIFILKTN